MRARGLEQPVGLGVGRALRCAPPQVANPEPCAPCGCSRRAAECVPYLQTTHPRHEKPLNNFHTPPALVLCGFAALAGVRTEQAAPLVKARDTTSPAKQRKQNMKTNVQIKTRPVGKQNRKERRMNRSRRWVALWALRLAGLTVTATMVCGATDSMGYDHSKKGI